MSSYGEQTRQTEREREGATGDWQRVNWVERTANLLLNPRSDEERER